MKKILAVAILSVLVFPALALAQATPPTDCTLLRDFTAIDPGCTAGSVVSIETFGACCALNSLQRVIDVIFFILVFIAIILFLIGAFTIVTAGGAPERVASGRNYILYAIVGLAIGFLARAVPAVAQFLIGA